MAGDRMAFIDPAGLEHVLLDQTRRDIGVLAGRQGLYLPNHRFGSVMAPSGVGSLLQSVRIEDREVTLPLYLEAPTVVAHRAAIRTLARALDPTRGDGRLRVTPEGSAEREIVCRLVEGLAGDDGLSVAGPNWLETILRFQTVGSHPYWEDVADTTLSFSVAQPQGAFFDAPFFPLRLVSDVVMAEISIQNSGDKPCWPVWAITGPGSSITLLNLTTGKRLEINVVLANGQSLQIDTRERKKTITDQFGGNQFALLEPGTYFWELAEGSNRVRVLMPNATPDSMVSLSYRQRYLTAA